LRYLFFHFGPGYGILVRRFSPFFVRPAPCDDMHHEHAPGWCNPIYQGLTMNKTNFFEDLQQKINKVIENSPAKDLERNVKAMLSQGFSKLDLVTREEFDVQAQVLAKTRTKLEALEARVAELEALLKKP
jgi:BMFP domain-containing protein YqiC